MAIVLRSQVDVIGRGLSIGGKPAIMDLHDDGRFVLVRTDPRTGEFGAKIIDTSVQKLSVRGASTYLYITADGRRTRIDFAGSSPVGYGSLGLIGAAIQQSYANDAGLSTWVSTLRRAGVLRGFSRTWRNIAIMLGVTFGVLLVVIVIAAVGRSLAG